MGIEKVKHVVTILSGKGGVGKSTIACQLGLCLAEMGHNVGLLDVDICGPSMPIILGMQGQGIMRDKDTNMMLPAAVKTVNKGAGRCVALSIALIVEDQTAAIVWRGPRKTALIKQFFNDTDWGELDFLIVDTPPGTSDEHITVLDVLKDVKQSGIVLITTPQQVSVDDVRKELTFVKKAGWKCLGVVENMSGFVCGHCSTATNIFSSGGGEKFAAQNDIPFLGKVPLDPALAECEDEGSGFAANFAQSPTTASLQAIVKGVLAQLQAPPAAE